MPWKECNIVEERLRFIARLLDGEKMSGLCREFGIARGVFRFLCQRDVASLIRSNFQCGIKSAFKKDRQLRESQRPVLDWHRPLFTRVLDAHKQQF